MVEGETDEIRYQAFLSYSHRDAAAAARLHRRLESYRIPRRLTGRETALGTVPDRLWPVFRDRDELPASSDLSESVKAALARSDALVVLCSLNAAGSRWIAREIETFRALRPDRPVLAAILEGEPGDCFPAALRVAGIGGSPSEPLATDLRPEGDGPQLGLLKLVAGITGLGLDDLVQRDASRRVKRVTAVTIVALIGMLITAALALVALDARREAERQRAEAEGLIEFMLTDLRTRLRGVGRLDVMSAVNERALEYYGGHEQLDELSPGSLLLRARILRSVGQDQMALSEYDSALAAFHEAHRITAEQIARDPDDARRLLEHARTEYRIGRVYEARREWSLAQRHYSLAASVADRLITLSPNNPDYMMFIASTTTDLGNVQLNHLRDAATAEASYRQAIRWFGRVVQARPADEDAARAYANAYANLADTFFLRERWHESLQARLRQYRLMERLYLAHPTNMENAYRLALAHRGVAVSSLQVRNDGRARSHLFQAYAWAKRLSDHDPANADWKLFKAMVACDLYFRNVGMPRAVTRTRLAREIVAAVDDLAAREDPRAAQLVNCSRSVRP